MTVAPTAETDRLDDDAYERAIVELRAYREQLDRADKQADAGSLDRAAVLAAIFVDKRWVDEVPAPKKTHFRGRPVVADSRSRFAKWVMERVGLQPRHCYQLLNANTVANSLRGAHINPGASEWALRPLSKLLRDERSDEIEAVWRRAVELADGESLTSAHVRQALRDHDKATGRTPTNRTAAYYQRTVKDARAKILREFNWILEHGSEDDVKAVLLEIQKRLAELTTPKEP